MVEEKDVVLAILGGSVSLTGLILVFIGLLAAGWDGIRNTAPRKAYTVAILIGAAFAFAINTTGTCLVWLISSARGGDGLGLYWVSIAFFAVILLTLSALFALVADHLLSYDKGRPPDSP